MHYPFPIAGPPTDAPASSATPAVPIGTADFRASPSAASTGVGGGEPPGAADAAPAAPAAEPGTQLQAPVCDSPRVVIRGESPLSACPEQTASPRPTAFIDWLAFTIAPPPKNGLRWLWPQLVDILNVNELKQRRNGWCGYAKSYDIGNYGLVACEGQQQLGTIHVSLNAGGCANVPDWERVNKWLGEELVGAITRVDLAHDDMDGAAVSIERALDWYHGGGFTSGGRAPAINRHGDWDNFREGRTLYIGKRRNGKLLRVYEKGKQLGSADSHWTRVELELRNRSRTIPHDVLIRPGHYLAGSFPCLGFISAPQERIRTIRKTNSLSLDALSNSARTAYGPLINVLMHVHAGDPVAVVNALIRPGVPRRLAPYSDFLPGNEKAEKQT